MNFGKVKFVCELPTTNHQLNMKSIFLTKHGAPEAAFEIREVAIPTPTENEVLIKVDAFGLNFADVMARKGLYDDCPPLPCVIGYEVVGRVESIGKNISEIKNGDRVVSMTRFGGYSEYVVADARAVIKIPEDISNTFAAALTVQYGTAYYSAMIATKVFEGETILIHAAAGGVGTALVQLMKLRGAKIFGTCSSDEKVKFLRDLGVDYPINYKTHDYKTEIKKILGTKKLNVVFDSLGGKYIRDGIKLLGPCGRMVCFGGAELNSATNIFSRWRKILQFGFYHPGLLMMQSKSIIGVNMLRVGDNQQVAMSEVISGLTELIEQGKIKEAGGREYPVSQLAEAHTALENRSTMGKVVVSW